MLLWTHQPNGVVYKYCVEDILSDNLSLNESCQYVFEKFGRGNLVKAAIL